MHIVVLILILLFPVLSHGEVYRWIDDNGQVHFGNVPPRVQEPYKPGEITDGDKTKDIKSVKRQPLQKTENDSVKKQEPENAQEPKNTGLASKEKNNSVQVEKEGKINTTYMPKTDKEKKQEAKKAKVQEEKFQTLINRLKNDLGAQEESQQEIKTKENELVEKSVSNNKNEKTGVRKKETILTNTEKVDKRKEIEENEIKNEIESVEKADVQYNEKCGFFKSFVDNYQDRIKYECPSEHCELLKKKLEKYEKKASQYCVDDNGESVN